MSVAYVDGSYNINTKRFGYGVVLFTEETAEDGSPVTVQLSKSFSEPELAEMRNVAGEIMGAAQVSTAATAVSSMSSPCSSLKISTSGEKIIAPVPIWVRKLLLYR